MVRERFERWIGSYEQVSKWLSKYEPLETQLDRNDGFIRIENFLPEFVASEILEVLKQLPEKRWDVRETTQDVQAIHRFNSAKPMPGNESDDLHMITRLFSSLLPEKMHTFQAGEQQCCCQYRTKQIVPAVLSKRDINRGITSRSMTIMHTWTCRWR
jgi:hypothetical protein